MIQLHDLQQLALLVQDGGDLDALEDFERTVGVSADAFLGLSGPEQNMALGRAIGEAKKRAVVRSDEFKQWLGNSLLVDDAGDPLVYYHGTYQSNFDEFDRQWSMKVRAQSSDTVGIWFSDRADENGAGMYANGYSGAQIIPVYLRAEKIKYYDLYDDFLRDMHEAEGRCFDSLNNKALGSPEGLRAKLKAQGFDAIAISGKNGICDLLDELKDTHKRMDFLREQCKEEGRFYAGLGMDIPKENSQIYILKLNDLKNKAQMLNKQIEHLGGSTEFEKQNVIIVLEASQIRSAIGECPLFGKEQAFRSKEQIRSESLEISY